MLDLLHERTRLLGLLVKRAERRSTMVSIAGRPVWYGRVSWPVIASSFAAYQQSHAAQLRGQAAKTSLPLETLDVALQCNLGMGHHRPNSRGAKRRLREVLIVATALRGMGEGLRFGELLAATNLPEQRLAFVLHWAKRQHVLVDANEFGWFLLGSDAYWRTRNAPRAPVPPPRPRQ